MRRATGRAVVLPLVLPLVLGVMVNFAQTSSLRAQAAHQAGADPAPGALRLSPAASLKAFEPDLDAPYTLGRGDEISIDFSGWPELNARRIIGPDGRITLPLAGAIELADKTREQAAAAIAQALSPYYDKLSVTVGVDRYTSNRVLLLGAVASPGVITFDRPPSLLEVLTRGGGLRNTSLIDNAGNGSQGGSSGLSGLRSTATVPQRCAIYRGNDQVIWVDLKGLLEGGSPLADLRLKRDDVVYVPSPLDRYVSMLGQVSHQGAFVLDNNTTLQKLLAEAGGITLQAGANPKISIISPDTGSTRVIEYKSLLQPNALDLTLRSGDIIFVPESRFNKVSYALNQLSPLISVLTVAALFVQ
jgi:polysaccharide export outer membrane protein